MGIAEYDLKNLTTLKCFFMPGPIKADYNVCLFLIVECRTVACIYLHPFHLDLNSYLIGNHTTSPYFVLNYQRQEDIDLKANSITVLIAFNTILSPKITVHAKTTDKATEYKH